MHLSDVQSSGTQGVSLKVRALIQLSQNPLQFRIIRYHSSFVAVAERLS